MAKSAAILLTCYSIIHLLHARAKIILPILRQSSNLQSASQRYQFLRSPALRNIQPCNFGYWKRIRISRQDCDLIARADLSFAQNGNVKTCSAARQESLHHIIGSKSNAQLVAGQSRLRDNHFRRTDSKSIANMDIGFKQPIRREVLPEDA